MWAEYMKEAEEYDSRVAGAWKEDANGILVFVSLSLLVPLFTMMTTWSWKTGLFSATVGAFIIESYKNLSPDSGDQTVVLLGKISQQLAGLTNDTYPEPPGNQPFSPSVSMIWVNAMWLMSLVLSIISALFATLLQQWARRYVEMPKIPSEPNDCARVRSFLFLGTQTYRMRLAVETVPTLLHLSVFLFFVGLIVFFFAIHKAVAIVVTISVGLFAMAYFVLTILPCIKHNCPYRTPMSNIWWYISHASLFSAAVCLHSLLQHLHDCIVPYNLGDITTRRQQMLVRWMQTFEGGVKKHGQRLKDGFRESIVQGALHEPNIDVAAIAWWLQLPALAEESKTQDFVARIPAQTIIQLISDPIESRKLIFREHLLTLLRSCGPDILAVGLSENERKSRLLVCLDAVHHIANASVLPDLDLDFVRTNFANISLMQAMWAADSDTAIRVTSRSICALLARRLMHKERLEEPELGWLHDVTGKTSTTIFNSDVGTRDRMNLKSFVYGVLLNQVDDLPNELATSFTITLAILMDAGTGIPFNRTKFEEQLSAFLVQIRQDDPERSGEITDKLRRVFQDFIHAPAPAQPVPASSTSVPPTPAPAPTP